MNETVFETIQESAEALRIDLTAQELAVFAEDRELTPEQLEAANQLFSYLAKKKHDKVIETLLRLSRLPDKQPKTFGNFDFDHLHGKQVERLRALQSLSPIYAHKNLAFIGPQGVGKTHLAMAIGYECCQQGMKTYFLKAAELNDKFTEARRRGREGSVINGLVKPSCCLLQVFFGKSCRHFWRMLHLHFGEMCISMGRLMPPHGSRHSLLKVTEFITTPARMEWDYPCYHPGTAGILPTALPGL